jgi:hypothetical protein
MRRKNRLGDAKRQVARLLAAIEEAMRALLMERSGLSPGRHF